MKTTIRFLFKITLPKCLVNRFTLACLMLFAIVTANGQVGIGTKTPDSSAALHIYDTARGLLVPRVTALQRNAIHNPAEGLMVYQTDVLNGFWYFSKGQWKNLVPANNGGKQTIVLSGDITDSGAVAKIAAEYGVNTQAIRIAWCSYLTTVDLSMVTSAIEISIFQNKLLKTVNLGGLVSVEGNFRIQSCPALTSVKLTSLEKMLQGTADYTYPAFIMSACGIQDLTFPALKNMTGDFRIELSDSLKSLSFPVLSSQLGNLQLQYLNNLVTVSFPALLNQFGNIRFKYNNNLATVSLPVLNRVDSLYFLNHPKLLTISAPALQNAKTLIIDNAPVRVLSFPSLDSVYSSISLLNNLYLRTASFPALNTADISVTNNSSLTDFSAPALKNGSIGFGGNIVLPSISFNSLTSGSVNVVGNLVLNAVSLPALTQLLYLSISDNGKAFSTLALPLLTSARSFTVQNSSHLKTVSLPALTTVDNFTLYCDSLTSFSSPALTTVTEALKVWPGRLSSFSLPALKTAGYVEIYAGNSVNPTPLITSVSFPVLTGLTSKITTIIRNLPITSIDLGNLTSFENPVILLLGNLLPSSQINYLLNKFVSITPPLTGKQFWLSQSVSAPPTGQGIADKATLIARGNDVQTN
ncbi:MAG: leucine-rich repeat protein [Ferruginibacter sp.]